MMRKLFDALRQKMGLSSKPCNPAVDTPAPAVLPAPPVDPIAEADHLIEAGNQQEDQQAFAAAIALYQGALARVPGYWRGHLNLGNAYGASGQAALALSEFRKAHAARPDSYGTCYSLGLALVQSGDQTEAIPFLQQALTLKPDHLDSMVVLAQALEQTKRYTESLVWFDQALTLLPDQVDFLLTKVGLLEALGRLDEAEAVALKLSEIPAAKINGLGCLGDLAKKQGEIDKALGYVRQSLKEHPGDTRVIDDYLMMLTYAHGLDQAWVKEEHRRLQHHYVSAAPLVLPPRAMHARKRIGFLSPDLRNHAVYCFVERLFALLDRSRFEVHAYYAYAMRDTLTDRIEAVCDVWRDISEMDAVSAAQQVAADEVDILIDLSGHTGYNRLDVMALKPAPITATWLGYLCTTGLDAMDYRIVDVHTDPVGMTEQYCSERLMRLPHSQWCYQPRGGEPLVNALPALGNGYITFGSFNNVAKLSDFVLVLWAQLLASVENSRLMIAAIPGGRAQQRILAALSARGFEASRLTFLGKTSREEYFQSYHQIDIALDSYPYHGGTTTCDALYMGVPVLSLAGQHSVARSGVSLMTNVGLPEWVGHSQEEFLAIGQRIAADVPALATLRATLRETFMKSPLGDQAAFAADFAWALDAMWQEKMGASPAI